MWLKKAYWLTFRLRGCLPAGFEALIESDFLALLFFFLPATFFLLEAAGLPFLPVVLEDFLPFGLRPDGLPSSEAPLADDEEPFPFLAASSAAFASLSSVA